MGGDGLTFEKIVKIKQYLWGQDNEFKRLDIIMPFLETWHTHWTYLCSLFEIHFDSSLSPDPSKLGHSMTKIDQKAPSNLKHVEYYKGCFAAYKTLKVWQLDCWRYVLECVWLMFWVCNLGYDTCPHSLFSLHFKTDNLFTYFESLPDNNCLSFETLQKTAGELHSLYLSTRAYQDAL